MTINDATLSGPEPVSMVLQVSGPGTSTLDKPKDPSSAKPKIWLSYWVVAYHPSLQISLKRYMRDHVELVAFLPERI